MDKEHWQSKGSGHRARLRDRFVEHGIDGFTDAEVLELLLSFGTPRKDCKEQARELLRRFGTFPRVLDAGSDELVSVHGVGAKNSFALAFVKAAANRYLRQRLRDKSYATSSQEVIDYLRHSMGGLQVEVFTALFLDASLGILASEEISRGTVTVNTVYPREIVRRAMHHNASALVVAHNHPSGSVNPSALDRSLTRSLYLICSMMQIRLIDHLIIGDTWFSFADNGIMAEIGKWFSEIDHVVSGRNLP